MKTLSGSGSFGPSVVYTFTDIQPGYYFVKVSADIDPPSPSGYPPQNGQMSIVHNIDGQNVSGVSHNNPGTANLKGLSGPLFIEPGSELTVQASDQYVASPTAWEVRYTLHAFLTEDLLSDEIL